MLGEEITPREYLYLAFICLFLIPCWIFIIMMIVDFLDTCYHRFRLWKDLRKKQQKRNR